MKRIYAHLGTHKTGTTTFQQGMRKKADWLAEHGIFFPPVGEHYGSRAGGLHSIPREFRNESAAPNVKGLDDFLRAFESTGLENALISTEGLSRLDAGQVARFSRRLAGYDVRPIMVFRNHIAFMTSLFCSNGYFKSRQPIERFLPKAALKWNC